MHFQKVLGTALLEGIAGTALAQQPAAPATPAAPPSWKQGMSAEQENRRFTPSPRISQGVLPATCPSAS